MCLVDETLAHESFGYTYAFETHQPTVIVKAIWAWYKASLVVNIGPTGPSLGEASSLARGFSTGNEHINVIYIFASTPVWVFESPRLAHSSLKGVGSGT